MQEMATVIRRWGPTPMLKSVGVFVYFLEDRSFVCRLHVPCFLDGSYLLYYASEFILSAYRFLFILSVGHYIPRDLPDRYCVPLVAWLDYSCFPMLVGWLIVGLM